MIKCGSRACGLGALFLVLLAGTNAQALHPHERPNTVFGFTLGPGLARVGLDLVDRGVFERDDQVGFGFGFRLGKMVRPDFALTLEGNGWTRRYDNVVNDRLIPTTVTVSVVGAAATYYPGQSGFYVRGGLGLGTGSVSLILSGLIFDQDEYGIGLLAGAGYEFRLGEHFAVGPALDFGGTRLGEAQLGGVVVDFDLSYVNFGVSANWYPGKSHRRPKESQRNLRKR